MSIKSKFRAFWKIATTRVPQKGWENVRGPDITRSPSISNTFRALVFGRGRKKRFYVVPTIRQVNGGIFRFRRECKNLAKISRYICYGGG